MALKCPACGIDDNEDSNLLCTCSYRNDSTSVVHVNKQQFVMEDITEEPVDPATEIKMSAMKNKIYFWGILRFCLGAIVACLIWVFLISRGVVTVYPFAFSIAVALSGLLSVITKKSFSELSDAWSILPGLLKFLLVIGISIGLYLSIFIIGVSLTSK